MVPKTYIFCGGVGAMVVNRMTRGIHLKRLTTTDLDALGLRDALPGADRADTQADVEPAPALADADPALSRAVCEVREGLEGTLRLLDQALAATAASDDP
jgi:hypothetical protein